MCTIGAFAFYEFLQLHQADLGTLANENQILVYILFLGPGLPLIIIGGSSFIDGWSDRFVRFVGFPASTLSGAILCAIAITSLPIFPTGYVTVAGVTIKPWMDYLRPRLSLGSYDVYFILGLGLLLLSVGTLLYEHLAKIHIGRRSLPNFILAYALVTLGAFFILYPWTMGASLEVPTLPAYCAGLVGGAKIPPSGCDIDLSRLGFAHPSLWPVTLVGLLAMSFGFIIGSRSTVALQSRPREFQPTTLSSFGPTV